MKTYFSLIGIGLSVILLLCFGTAFAAPKATGAQYSLLGGQGTPEAPAMFDFVPWVNDAAFSDTFKFHILTQPSNGKASAIDQHSMLEYTPNLSFTQGTDSFTFRTTNQSGEKVHGTAHIRVYSSDDHYSASHSSCTSDSVLNSDGTLNPHMLTISNKCTFYTSRQTRVQPDGTPDGTAVTMDYFINWPSLFTTVPKAVVVLIGGGDLDMGFKSTSTIGVPDNSGGGNFLVRTAQIFADAGYLTVAINKPSDQPPANSSDSTLDADMYRVSINHAVDILRVLKHVNTENLPVYIAGTSLGTLSAVALNQIATGISLSSPAVHADKIPSHYYIGDGTPNLEPSFVERPVHVLWNTVDNCKVVDVADGAPMALYTELHNQSPSTVNYDTVTSTLGQRVSTASGSGSTAVVPDDCGAFDYHGYFERENEAAGKITAWLDTQVTGHILLEAKSTTITIPSPTKKHHLPNLLAKLTAGNQGVLTYGLYGTPSTLPGVIPPLYTSSLGASLSIDTSTGAVTYYPTDYPTDVSTDYFVYYVTDGNGNVGAGVVTVHIGN